MDSTKEFELVDIDEDHIKGTAFNMVFMIWRLRTTAEAYRRGIKTVRDLAQLYPEGIGILQVVETDAIPPDAEARKVFVELLRSDLVKHYSVTHEGTGFKAAAVRAIVSSGQTMARPKFPHAVHKTVAEASVWHAAMQRDIGRRELASQIERIAQSLRRLHYDQYPT